ncbi:MAG: oligosaccharide flippase family protein [Patescibacteria group bacterium]
MNIIRNLREKTYKILRHSEKYTHTDMVYLAKGSTWLNLGTLLDNGLIFLLAVAFANFLPKEVYGTYKYILSVVSILIIANLSGIKGAAIRAVSRGYEKIITDGLKARIKWGFLSSLAALGIGLYYLSKDNSLLAGAFLISAAFLPFFQSADIYTSYLTGKKMFRQLAQCNVLTTVIYALLMSAFILLTDNLFLIILAYFGSYVFTNNFLFVSLAKKFRFNKKEDPEAMSYGKHLSLMNIINAVASYLDRIILFHFVGPAEMAVYYFATAVPDRFRGFFKFIEDLALPKWSVARPEEIKISIKRKLLQLLAVVIALITAYYFAAPWAYKIFFSQYIDSVFYSQIYMLSFLNIVPTFVTTALQAEAKVKELYIFNIINPLIQIGLIIILAVMWGVLGVVLARVISRLLSSVIALLFYKRI